MASPHSPLRGYTLTPVCNPESERIGFPLIIVIVVVVVVVVVVSLTIIIDESPGPPPLPKSYFLHYVSSDYYINVPFHTIKVLAAPGCPLLLAFLVQQFYDFSIVYFSYFC